jgi:hypothetical protein
MSKRNTILIIIIFFIVLIGTFFYFYFFSENKTNKNNPEPTEEFPFGTTQNKETNINNNTNNGSILDNLFGNNSSSTENTYNNIKLRQIYKKPVSGMFFINKNGIMSINFLDRASGNIFNYQTNNPTLDPVRITNTTIPKIQESVFFNGGQSIILRYIDDLSEISSFIGKISTSSDPNINEINGEFLLKNIREIVTSPENKNIFELIDNPKGGISGYTYSTTTPTNKKEIFNSPISLWNISWPKEEIITFTTKPNYKEPGFLFFLNTKSLSFDRVIGNVTGLTTNTNNTTELVSYSENKANSLKLNIYDIKNQENKNIELNTISDKCVWGNLNTKTLYCAVPNNIPKGNYPDDWYQGNISFNDGFWQINTEEGTTKNIYENKEENSLNIDAIDLKLSPDDKYISFINKNDLSLWLLDLTENNTVEQ